MENQKISLADLKPQDASATMSSGVEFHLRHATIADVEWMQTFFKNKDFSDVRKVCFIVFRLLKDKSDYVAKEVEDVNEDGEKIMVKKTPTDLIMTKIITANDFLELTKAMNTAMGNSPKVNEMIEERVGTTLEKKS